MAAAASNRASVPAAVAAAASGREAARLTCSWASSFAARGDLVVRDGLVEFQPWAEGGGGGPAGGAKAVLGGFLGLFAAPGGASAPGRVALDAADVVSVRLDGDAGELEVRARGGGAAIISVGHFEAPGGARAARAAVARVCRAADCDGYDSDDDLPLDSQRTRNVWEHLFPLWLDYEAQARLVDLGLKSKADLAELHVGYAPKVLDFILQNRGVYVKLGQMVSATPMMFPRPYHDELQVLQAGVPSKRPQRVRRMVEEALGRPADELFASFDCRACGAASIGEAHRATTRDGREVVVKLMYPLAQRAFDLDMQNIVELARACDPDRVPEIVAVHEQMKPEFDYMLECSNLLEVHHNLRGFRHVVAVPEPLPHLSSTRALTMEYLPGPTLLSALREEFARLAPAVGRASGEDLIRDLRAAMGGGPDALPSDAATLPLAVGALTAVRKQLVRVPPAWRRSLAARGLRSARHLAVWWNEQGPGVVEHLAAAAGLLMGPAFAKRKALAHAPIPEALLQVADEAALGFLAEEAAPLGDPEDRVRQLFAVHAHQVLVDGCFNTDPHPGNVLLVPDGRIGLIDFGAVTRLTVDERLRLCRLFCAMHERDSEGIASAAGSLGFRSASQKVGELNLIATLDRWRWFRWDGLDPESAEHSDVPRHGFRRPEAYHEVFFKSAALDCARAPGGEALLAVQKLCVILMNTAFMMGSPMPVSISRAWYGTAAQVLAQHGEPRPGWTAAVHPVAAAAMAALAVERASLRGAAVALLTALVIVALASCSRLTLS